MFLNPPHPVFQKVKHYLLYEGYPESKLFWSITELGGAAADILVS